VPPTGREVENPKGGGVWARKEGYGFCLTGRPAEGGGGFEKTGFEKQASTATSSENVKSGGGSFSMGEMKREGSSLRGEFCKVGGAQCQAADGGVKGIWGFNKCE